MEQVKKKADSKGCPLHLGEGWALTAPYHSAKDPTLTLAQGGMLMFRWQSACWRSSYFMALRKKDREPLAPRLLSRT